MSFGKLLAQEEEDPPSDTTPPQVVSVTTTSESGGLTVQADIVDDVEIGNSQTVTIFGDTLTLIPKDGLWEVSGIELAPMPRGSYEIDFLTVQDAAGNTAVYDYNDNPAIGTIDIEDRSIQGTFADALDNTTLPFATSGDTNWRGWAGGVPAMNHDGADAAQSGPTRNDQQSTLSTSVIGPGTLAFWWKVSSEPDFNFLQLKVDADVVGEISGNGTWEQVTVSIPSGNHSIDWVFTKDGTESEGTDCGWVDEVVFTPGASDPYADWGLRRHFPEPTPTNSPCRAEMACPI